MADDRRLKITVDVLESQLRSFLYQRMWTCASKMSPVEGKMLESFGNRSDSDKQLTVDETKQILERIDDYRKKLIVYDAELDVIRGILQQYLDALGDLFVDQIEEERPMELPYEPEKEA